jgi:hypothetical protein
MILKELYLYPDLVDYNDEIVHPFRDQSRSICNYLERHLKLIKFNTEGFKRICFIGKSEPNPECLVNSSNVLIGEVNFDEKKYKSLNEDQLNAFFLSMLVKGIEKCQNQYNIPGKELLEWLKNFQDTGFVNRWTFKTKIIKSLGVKCSLNCELTIQTFHLSLTVSKGKDIVFNREILKTEPDEIVFMPLLNEVSLMADSIIVLDKFGNSIYEVKVQELNL